MLKLQCLSFLSILFSVVACAPINYEATYRPPSVHKSSQTYTRPIQVTLYSDSAYLGVNFEPIQITISDGQYVEIPVKNRRGRPSRIFAHYHRGNLHFDGNRKCQKLLGSTGYQYDRRWDKGYKYTHVNAGHNYDFTGLRLVIRNAPEANSRSGSALSQKTPSIHTKTIITNKYQSVKRNNKNSHNKKVVVHKQIKNVKNKVGVEAKASMPKKQSRSEKHLDVSDKIRVTSAGKKKKPVVPNIVQEVSRHHKTDTKSVTVRRNDRKLTERPASKRSIATQGSHSASEAKRHQAKSQSQSAKLATNVSQTKQNKSMQGRGGCF